MPDRVELRFADAVDPAVDDASVADVELVSPVSPDPTVTNPLDTAATDARSDDDVTEVVEAEVSADATVPEPGPATIGDATDDASAVDVVDAAVDAVPEDTSLTVAEASDSPPLPPPPQAATRALTAIAAAERRALLRKLKAM